MNTFKGRRVATAFVVGAQHRTDVTRRSHLDATEATRGVRSHPVRFAQALTAWVQTAQFKTARVETHEWEHTSEKSRVKNHESKLTKTERS